MDKEVFAKILSAIADDESTPAELIKFGTEEDAIRHAEWAAKLLPGDKVNASREGICVVTPEGVKENRISLFYVKKRDDGTYGIGSMICPVGAISPVD